VLTAQRLSSLTPFDSGKNHLALSSLNVLAQIHSLSVVAKGMFFAFDGQRAAGKQKTFAAVQRARKFRFR
jgi:hypothetical protein